MLKLSVKPEMVSVTVAHMDESLEKEDGENVAFNVSFWKVNNGGYSRVSCILILNLFIHYISVRGLL